jgi:hypothetical protein
MLVEQLDMATSTLCKESQEVEWLRLSVAGAKREMVAAELATTKDEARLTGKAFDMI